MIETVVSGWEDYELLDSGNGQRLERFGSHTIVRPDPNVRWLPTRPELIAWKKADARYVGKAGAGDWETKDDLRNGWTIEYGEVFFRVRPTPFRHVGLFPEQSAHWEWLKEKIAGAEERPQVLNLFGYTGAASVVAAQAGASVCHVDASQGSINWAKENAHLSDISTNSVRWIMDDVLKFMEREVRRGKRYDLIIMDPPVFGHGPGGEIWRIEENIAQLAQLASELLEEKPLGLLVNFYATALYPESIARVFAQAFGDRLNLELGSLLIEEKYSKKKLPTGFFLRS